MSEEVLETKSADGISENALAGRILLLTAAVLIIAIVAVAVFGLPALGILGLLGTVACFALLLMFMIGN
ncbi:hypothetical protein [Paracoccus aerodenitrificans]|uniref:hypothetical protein n=1 Tax=Paracoccus aerodenitrificans TaxID=3017781 RepID=UPI0022F07D67|nr:hypothetical protein [Paracoccus aerodenitrificans]WBU64607.1 hypothetical protein PAE61_03960 [Paracoccus aerodenitrificans]